MVKFYFDIEQYTKIVCLFKRNDSFRRLFCWKKLRNGTNCRHLHQIKLHQNLKPFKQIVSFNYSFLMHPKYFRTNSNLFKCSHCHDGKNTSPPKDHGRSTYHKDLESAMNQQIHTELNASYTYFSMACYFGNTNVALPGSHGFYMKMHQEEYEHATMLINYQNLRGGSVELSNIEAPKTKDWISIANTLDISLDLENLVKEVSAGNFANVS